MFYGRGAGKLPTASAVVADVIDCVKHTKARKYLDWAPAEDNYVVNYLDIKTRLFIRAKTDDYNADKKNIVDNFGEVQFLSNEGNEIAFVTGENIERELRADLEKSGLKADSIIHIL